MTAERSYTHADVQAAVNAALEREREELRTKTIEGRLETLTATVARQHETIIGRLSGMDRRLDEANHLKPYIDERLSKTEKAIAEMMASHLDSPSHTLINQHLSQVSKFESEEMQGLSNDEVSMLPSLLRDALVRKEVLEGRSEREKRINLRVSTVYASMGTVALFLTALTVLLHFWH